MEIPKEVLLTHMHILVFMMKINRARESYYLLITIISLLMVILINAARLFFEMDNIAYIIIFGLVATLFIRGEVVIIIGYVLRFLYRVKGPDYNPNIRLDSLDFNISTSIIICGYYTTNTFYYTQELLVLTIVTLISFFGTYYLLKYIICPMLGIFAELEIDSNI